MPIFRTTIAVCFLLFISVWPAHSASPEKGADLKTVVSTLEEGYRLLKDLQADFSQKTSISSVKREEKGSGELAMKRPSGSAAMFRFDYKKPRQQIVSDGRQVWFYLPDNKQVMVSDVKTMLAQGGVALNYLTGMGNVSRDFTVVFAGKGRDSKGNYLLDLTPKKGGQAFSKLQLTISAGAVEQYLDKGAAQEPFPILASIVYDQMGNRTLIEYARVRTNQGVPAGKFSFKVPSGVEVIKP